MDIVGQSLSVTKTSSDILKDIWPWLHDNIRYKKILDESKTTLIKEMETLSAREKDVNNIITEKLKHVRSWHEKKLVTKNEVENWLEKVRDQKAAVEDKLQEANKRRYFRRSKFLRLVREKTTDVRGLLEGGIFPEGLFNEVHQDRELKFGKTTLVGKSAEKIIETILESLKNEKRIGVCGMGGAGKTTIVTQVQNKLLEDRETYGHVYWVTVAEDLDTYKLQDKIADVLNLGDFSKHEDKKVRTALLSEELTKREKFVLILDDMWEAFPLEEVGIPIDENGAKIILTSRLKDVCNRMSCQQIIQVKTLEQEEAWDLFMEKFGREKVFVPEVEECAKSIVNECHGLPLAIITVARAMRGAINIHSWRIALKRFKKCSEGANGMKTTVIKQLKFSYDRLTDEKLQKCFLYCALFPEDWLIEKKYLITCWIAEGLLEETETRQEELDEGRDLLGRLEDAYLLEYTRNNHGCDCVKMHDLIRDMALEITAVDGQFMVNTSAQLMDFPSERNWLKNLERVSFMASTITGQLSHISPTCPRLCTLILQSIRHIEEIPNSLFLHLRNLRVLDMSNLEAIVHLPDSISELEKLRALLLKGCASLRCVPSLAKLTELRDLDLRDTAIEEFPLGLEKLVNLKSLLLCTAIKITNDEEMTQIRSLEQLEVLSVNFDNLLLFNSYVKTQPYHQRRLSRYVLQLRGTESGVIEDIIRCGCVHVHDIKLIVEIENSLVLPTNIQELEIDGCYDLTSLSDISSCFGNAKELERCCIQLCSGIEHLWSWPTPSLEEDCRSNTDTSSLQRLRTLYLWSLENLRVIFNFKGGRVGGCGAFSNLKLLIIYFCRNLKYVFTQGLVQHYLKQLEIIHVSDCYKMENIIVAEEEESKEEEIVVVKEEEVTCPNLKRLELGDLPELKSIWRGTLVCPSLQQIKVERCGMLMRLPLSQHSQTSSSLQQIKGSQKWWDLLVWDTHDAKSIFQPRFYHCEAKIFSLNAERLWEDDLGRYEEY